MLNTVIDNNVPNQPCFKSGTLADFIPCCFKTSWAKTYFLPYSKVDLACEHSVKVARCFIL